MSIKSSLKEALERRGETKENVRSGSASRTIRLLLLADGSIGQPVRFIQLLASCGLSLKKGRAVLERLATKQPVVVTLSSENSEPVRTELEKLGIASAIFKVPDVNVKQIREEQQLSQPEFAHLYGLEVDTVKNWEQGRYEPDGPARVLLSVIEECPRAVIDSIARWRSSRSGRYKFKSSAYDADYASGPSRLLRKLEW